MSQTVKNQISEWREKIRKFGKNYFVIEDMTRLGFLNLTEEDLQVLRDGNADLNKINAKIRKIDNEIGKLEDVETVLKKIRQLRIERVRKERAIRKAEKAAAKKAKKEEEKKWRSNTPPYLGEGVSAGLNYKETNAERLQVLGLPLIQNAEEMATAMELEVGQISWLSYHRVTAKTDHYHRFQIPKRKGGFRTIASPKPTLRKAQSWILREILSKIPLHEAAMAFRPNRSIVDNAHLHKQKGVIIKMDLKDFFPSIQFRRVKGLFKSFGYNEGVATIFALICTDAARINAKLDDKNFYVALSERYLPQGACTSPAITNIICRKMDKRMTGLAKTYGWTYSRYADDMVFSHPDKGTTTVKTMLNCTKSIVKDENFELHPDKLAVLRPHQRQAVTGIVVNETPTVSRRDMRKFRSFLHHYEQVGNAVTSMRIGKDAKQYAQGYWAFINMVNSEKAAKLLVKHPWLK